jgi:zinc protease
MIRKLLRIAAGILALAPVVRAQQAAPLQMTQALGVDPAITVGTLANGMRYYIRKNTEPAKRAELRLAINAGSINEDDNQRGYAHFVEHTAFNGTRNFRKNDLVKYLQSIGVRFGADLNAYTGFDETVYQLSIPTDTARIVEQAFLILEDWAHGQIFDSTEVVSERGVVQEEWRGGLGASERMMNAAIPIILKDSKYAQRIPIGTQESILSAQPSILKKFYQDWYRPDLMAIVAVGDFDVKEIEALISKHFSGLQRVANPRPRVESPVPNNVAPLIAITTDPENTSSGISIDIKHPARTVRTVGDYRRQLAEGLYFSIINSRLREIAQRSDPPFIGAGVSNGGFIGRTVESLSFGATVKDNGIERGIEAVLMEVRRVDQFGFLEAELNRAKENTLRSYQRMYDERAKTHSGALVNELVGNFLEGEVIPGIEMEYRLANQVIPSITLAEVNSLARDWITDENRVIWVNAPKKEGISVPTADQVIAVIDRAAKAQVTPWVENLADAPLLASLPAPGRVVSTKTVDAVGLTEWTLSNGARVLVKPTDFKADEVLFSATSPGGNSLVPDSEYMSAVFAPTIMQLSGLGEFNAVDLQKKLAGKVAGANASISTISEGLAGGASPKDLETLFQLIHLRFTGARIDSNAIAAFKSAAQTQLANRPLNPNSWFEDTVSVTMTQNHFRARPPTPAIFAELDAQKALQFYRERFANAGDFTFLFVGSINLESLKPLVEKYLASLPGTGRVDKWKDIGDRPPVGVVEKTVYKGTEPQAETRFYFTGPFNYSPESRFDMLALTTLAEMWLTDALREEMGGTYSPSLSGGGGKEPRSEYTIIVDYTSSPEQVDKLSARLFRVIDSLKTYGPNEADLGKVREQIIRSRETQLKTNAYWRSNIMSRDQNGEDIAGLLAPYDEMVKALTTKQIQDAAKLYFNMKQYARFVHLPEKKAQ